MNQPRHVYRDLLPQPVFQPVSPFRAARDRVVVIAVHVVSVDLVHVVVGAVLIGVPRRAGASSEHSAGHRPPGPRRLAAELTYLHISASASHAPKSFEDYRVRRLAPRPCPREYAQIHRPPHRPVYTQKSQGRALARNERITSGPHLSPAQREGATIHEDRTINGHVHPSTALPVCAARQPTYMNANGFPANIVQDTTVVQRLSTWYGFASQMLPISQKTQSALSATCAHDTDVPSLLTLHGQILTFDLRFKVTCLSSPSSRLPA